MPAPDPEQPIHLTILFRDQHLVAIDKPAGLLVHRSSIDRHATRFALQMLRDQIGRRVYPLHRLDRPTSGVLLFALDADTARRMGQAFEANEVTKEYLAIVRGYPDPAGRIDYALEEARDPHADPRTATDKAPQPAVTEFRRLATVELPVSDGRHPTSRYALVGVRPLTGRRHQIRRHLKHIFHPIIGDTTHGDGRHNRLFREQFACQRLLLCATAIGFTHPFTGAALRIRTAPDGCFADLIERFGWSGALADDAPAR